MRKKTKNNNSSKDNITLRTISSKNKTLNYYDNNDLKYSIDYSKSVRSKKAINKESFDKKKSRNNLSINSSKNIMYRNNYNNLSCLNYAKSLNLMINNHTQAVNTQFSNYNKFKFQKKNDEAFQIENNRYKYNNIHLFKKEEKENINNTSKKKGKSNRNIKSRNKKKNNVYGYSINSSSISEFCVHDNNRKVVIIQSVFRGYYIRNKLYNTIFLYTMIKKFIFILQNKIKIFKKIFFNNLKQKGKDINDNNNRYEKSQKNNNDVNPNMNNIQYFIYNINNINNINIEKKSKKVDNLRYSQADKDIFRKEKGINKDIKNELLYESKLIIDKNIENQKNEEEYDNVIQKKEKLNKEKDIYKQNKALLLELNSIKEKYNKLLNEKKKVNFMVSKSGEINIEKEKNNYDFDITKSIELYINKVNENKSSNNIISIMKKKKIINPNFIKLDTKNKEGKEKYLSKLFNKKVEQYESYIHKCFGRFYYNGIFLQMTGKLNNLNKNKNSDEENNNNMSNKYVKCYSNKTLSKFRNKFSKSVSFIDYNNRNVILVDNDEHENNEHKIKGEFPKIEKIKNINLYESVIIGNNDDEERIKEEKERNDLKERLRKSRGLRKLMNKKASEKHEMLRYYFLKFYRAGLFISRFKAYSRKRRSCQFSAPINIDLGQLSSKEMLKIVSKKEVNKKEEKEKKEEKKENLTEMLQKIFYKTDRRNMVIISKVFKRFYLKAKLESLKDVLDNNKEKKKKKKLKRRNTTAIINRNDRMNSFKGEKAKSAEIIFED